MKQDNELLIERLMKLSTGELINLIGATVSVLRERGMSIELEEKKLEDLDNETEYGLPEAPYNIIPLKKRKPPH